MQQVFEFMTARGLIIFVFPLFSLIFILQPYYFFILPFLIVLTFMLKLVTFI